MANSFIPAGDAPFNEWQKNLVTYLKANAAAWGIPAAQIERIEAEQAEFESRYAVTENPATRTKPAIVMKDGARKIFEGTSRTTLKAYVTYNPAVTDEDRINMGLPIHKTTRTAVSVPNTFPEYTVETSLRRVTIHFRDAGSGKKAKPAGVNGAVIHWAILNEAPTDVKMLINSALDTASPYTLEFSEAQRGSRVYFCLVWQNTKGEKGPWSEIGMAIVP